MAHVTFQNIAPYEYLFQMTLLRTKLDSRFVMSLHVLLNGDLSLPRMFDVNHKLLGLLRLMLRLPKLCGIC